MSGAEVSFIPLEGNYLTMKTPFHYTKVYIFLISSYYS